MTARFKRYPSYKDTGVEWLGRIPTHWETHRLKHVATVQPSNVDKKSEDGELPVKLCNYVDVYYNDRITADIDFMQATATEAEKRKFQLQTGDVCVTKDSEEWSDIAVPAYVAEKVPDLLCGYHLALVRPRVGHTGGEFLARAFSARGVNDQFRVEANGITRFALGQDALCNAQFPVPPLDEQQAISEFLDRETGKIDALVKKKERLIELLQEKRTALISHAVTQGLNPNAQKKDSGIPWIGLIPKHWTLLRLNRLTKSMTAGPFGSSLTKDMYVSKGFRVYGQEQVIPADFSIGDYFISPEKYTEMRQYAVSPGDVLVSCVGTFGKVAVVPSGVAPGIINPRLAKLKPDTRLISSGYMGLILTSRIAFDQMEQISRGGTMGVLNLGMLSTLLLPVPELSEQSAIIFYVESETAKLDTLMAKVRTAIERLQEYRTALISAAVTGQIDVCSVSTL